MGAVPPCPEAGTFLAGDQSAPAVFADVDKLDGSFIGFRRDLHSVEDPFRSGQSRQEEISLLGKLIDGHGGLAGKDKITCQTSDVRQAEDHHDSSYHGDYCIINIRNAYYCRDHGGGVPLGALAGFLQIPVFFREFLQIFFFVVKDLYHLLARHHFFNISVQFAEISLVAVKIKFAFSGTVADIKKHSPISQDNEKGKSPV